MNETATSYDKDHVIAFDEKKEIDQRIRLKKYIYQAIQPTYSFFEEIQPTCCSYLAAHRLLGAAQAVSQVSSSVLLSCVSRGSPPSQELLEPSGRWTVDPDKICKI